MIFPLNPTVHQKDHLTDDEFWAFSQAKRHLRIGRDGMG